jgi:hypothetical protein
VHLVGADHHLLDVCAAESADELALFDAVHNLNVKVPFFLPPN